MISEIKRVRIRQAGNVGAAVCGIIGVVLFLFAVVFLLVDLSAGLSLLVVAVLYPILGFFGWMMAAALYNLAARMVGGLQFEYEPIDDGYRSAAAQDDVKTVS